jgi:hypothetical protein
MNFAPEQLDVAGLGTCPLPNTQYERVLLGHGSGGSLSADLIRNLFVPGFGGEILAALEDQATVDLDGVAGGQRLAFTTDSFVVRPIFFPGGDVGTLAVNGTVNDLAVGGATPRFLSAAFILEEGLALIDLRRIVASMRRACDEAGVALVTGDTKVVDRGKGDQVFIATSGIGVVLANRRLSIRNARPGDRVLLSGTIGDHGIAIGTCATYGGIHAMQGNPTGAMGLADYLGWGWRSKAGLPIVNVPGCPVQPDNFMETLLYLLYQAAGLAPMIPLDQQLRPTWLFGKTVHEGCDRAGYYEQADFAHEYGSPKCLVKIGCWGPVVNCNVTKRGWMAGIGGCPNVGGICIGCTMPGFPDKFMPFMDEPPGAKTSSSMIRAYGALVRRLRAWTQTNINKEPKWRHPGSGLTTGYHPTTYHHLSTTVEKPMSGGHREGAYQ